MSDTHLHPQDHERRPASPPTRSAGVVGALGATATLVSGLVVAAWVQPRSDVPDDQFSFPWSADDLLPVSVTYAVLHLMVAVGLVGLARSGLTGSSRAARAGQGLAVLGSVVLVVAELVSLLVRDGLMDDAAVGRVGALFGAGTLLSLVGFLVLGATTLQAGRWPGWGRWTPLAVGLALVVLMAVVVTPALAAGVGLFGLSLVVLFVAFVTAP